MLKSVPEQMDGLYSRILQNLARVSRNKGLARAVLKRTVCAARPLTVEELKQAISFDIGETLPRLEKTAGSLCGHLVYVDSQSRVQVAHQTVRAFFFKANGSSEYGFDRQKEHTKLSEVCLGYLCGDDMKTSRYRRGGASSRSSTRSAFADYATVHFADHLVRSTSSSDTQLLSLNIFLQTNSLTWIELVAGGQDLNPVTQAAKNFKSYLERRAKYCSPLGQEVQNVSAWSGDLIQLVAKFGKALLASPHAIQFLIPPVCPPESIIARTFKDYPRALRMVGLSQKDWDDQLCCIGSSDMQALSVACRDNRFAVGTSDGIVRVYHSSTFQEELRLTHGEPVRGLEFGSVNTGLATAGRTRINIWNSASGILLRTLRMHDHILTFDFNSDSSLLMVATKANSLKFWRVADGIEVDTYQFCDIDEEHGHESHYLRPPTHAAFSTELKLLAVAYRQRPVNLWDLENSTLVGQFHKSAVTYPGPLIFALIFNSSPGLCLAAAAYDDGDLVTFDPWNQKQQASVSAEAVTLASSPDGTILVTGDGVGVISLYEFETLRLLYRINSFEQSIRSVVFNSNNLRFFDIRGGYCNVWEPPVLVRRTDSGEASSIDVSEEMPSGPQLGTTSAYDDDRAITAMTVHHEGEIIFCGREDGSVAAYSTATGKVVEELFCHTKNVAVLLVEWGKTGNLLASVDRSGRVLVREIVGFDTQKLASGAPVLDQKTQSAVAQLQLSLDGKRLLVSMLHIDQLWSLEDGMLVSTRLNNTTRTSWRWVAYASDPEKLLLFENSQMQVLDWNNLASRSPPKVIELGFETASSRFFSSAQDDYLFISFPGSRADDHPPRLHLLHAKVLTQEVEKARFHLSYDKLAKNLKTVVGQYKSLLVFLTHDGWICSLNVDHLCKRQSHYTKHFFIPFRLHNRDCDLMILVTSMGSVVLSHGDELVAFHNGLEFVEEIELEPRLQPPRPSKFPLRKTSSSSTVDVI